MTKGEELGLWVEDILSLAFNKGSLGKGREESLVGKDSQPSPHSPPQVWRHPLHTLRLGTGVSEALLGLGGQVLDYREHASDFPSVQWASG